MLVISNRPRVSRSSDFEITRAITPWIVLHSVQLLLLIIYKQQFLHKNMSINFKSVEFHLCHAKTTFDLFFTTIRQKSLSRFVDNWKHRLGLESARAALCKWLLVLVRLSFPKLSQILRSTCRNNTKKCLGKQLWRAFVADESTDHDKPHFDLFSTTISTSKKMFYFFRVRAENSIARQIDATSVVWLGPSNFWLVRSEHAHASYPGLSFRPPGFSPYMRREERRVQGLDYKDLG